MNRTRRHDLKVDWAPYTASGYIRKDPPTSVLPIAVQEDCGCVEVYYPNPPTEEDKDHNRTYPLYCGGHENLLGLCSQHRIPAPGCNICETNDGKV